VKYHVCDPDPQTVVIRGALYEAADDTRSVLATIEPRLELAQDAANRWDKNEFRVRFIGGSEYQRMMVQKVIEGPFAWPQFCAVKFHFDGPEDADIRIAFEPGGCWSQLGKYSKNGWENNVPSMNFGWLDENSDVWEWQRVVVHEFGHALGLIHEHQSPAAHIPWNEPVVLAHYLSSMGWSESQVRANVFEGWSADQCSNYSAYDGDSIMAYWIAEDWVTDPAYAHGSNRIPSRVDRESAAQWFGVPERKSYCVTLPWIARS